MLGDHILNNDPDCQRNKFGELCNPTIITKKVDKTIIHKNYNQTDRTNNIALIRLDERVTLHNEDPVKSIVAPVCLPWPDSFFGQDIDIYIKEGRGVRLTGWGKVTNLNQASSNPDRTLQQESLKIAIRTDCPKLQDNQLCVGTKKRKCK